MIDVTHVYTWNGLSKTEVIPELAESLVRRVPTLLDGGEEWAISLCRLPAGRRLREMLPAGWDRFCLQAAGSAEAMMVEVIKQDPDGLERLYKLARRLPDGVSSAGVVDIVWNGRVDPVPAEEAFDAVEAGDIFWYYYQHDAVPDAYELRFFDV